MSERPILFTDEMVRAILDGAKTQTRRTINPHPFPDPDHAEQWDQDHWTWASRSGKVGIFYPPRFKCPYGQRGDQLWVREAFRWLDEDICGPEETQFMYRADEGLMTIPDDLYSEDPIFSRLIDWTAQNPNKWKPSIHMPRWASRLLLKIKSIRVEPLQEISDEDAAAEGVNGDLHLVHFQGSLSDQSNRRVFQNLWDSINGTREGRSWEENPWVWVIEFQKVEE